MPVDDEDDDDDRGLELYKQALDDLAKARERGGEAAVIEALSDVVVFCEEPQAKLAHALELHAVATEQGESEGILEGLHGCMDALLKLAESDGDWNAAREAAEALRIAAVAAGDQDDQLSAELGLTTVEIRQEDFQAAATRLDAATVLAESMPQEPGSVSDIRAIGIVTHMLDLARAQQDEKKVVLLEEQLAALRARYKESHEKWMEDIVARATQPVPLRAYFSDWKTALPLLGVLVWLIKWLIDIVAALTSR